VIARDLRYIVCSALGWAPLIDDPRRPGPATVNRFRWISEVVDAPLPVAQVAANLASWLLRTLEIPCSASRLEAPVTESLSKAARLVIFGRPRCAGGQFLLICALFGSALPLVRRMRTSRMPGIIPRAMAGAALSTDVALARNPP
jgi:hypothetical protein